MTNWDLEREDWWGFFPFMAVQSTNVNISRYLMVVVVHLLCVLTRRIGLWGIFALLLQGHRHEIGQSLTVVPSLHLRGGRRCVRLAHRFVCAVGSRLVIGRWRVCGVRTRLLRDAEAGRAAGRAENRLIFGLSQSAGDINGFVRSSASSAERRSCFSHRPSFAHRRLFVPTGVCITAVLFHRQPAIRIDRRQREGWTDR